ASTRPAGIAGTRRLAPALRPARSPCAPGSRDRARRRDAMTDKHRARKSAARRRAAATGQSYQAAHRDVQRDRMGFAEAAGATEHRPRAAATAYVFAWGAHRLAGDQQLRALVAHAEEHGLPRAADPILCGLCDHPVDVTR